VLSAASLSDSVALARPVLPDVIKWSYEPERMVAAALSYLTTAAAAPKKVAIDAAQRRDVDVIDEAAPAKTMRHEHSMHKA